MAKAFNIPQFRLNHKGMARFLGTLEARIMEIVWKREAVTVQDVCEKLGRGSNYKTVMTVMQRLNEKGFLERKKVSRAFVYQARLSRDQFLQAASHQIVTGLVSDFQKMAVTQFIDVLDELDPHALETLEQLIRDRSKGK
jgi:predicted transcriptional regulator